MSDVISAAFAHLEHMSDERGLFEHADRTEPRVDGGYCTDDNARLLVVTSREVDIGRAGTLSRLALRFVRDAQDEHGKMHNRMGLTGEWEDEATTEDCWGRAMWGLGVCAAHHTNPAMRRWAHRALTAGLRQRSPWSRATAFATLGVAEVAAVDGCTGAVRSFLVDSVVKVGQVPSGEWSWPEPMLRYANATVAEALIAAGSAIRSQSDVDRGLRMLDWLLRLETVPGHLSVVGSGGRTRDERGPQFDQQPIEVAAMADACWRAREVTGDPEWTRGITAASDWFMGANDIGLKMYDEESGGSYDGLHADRVNLNQGAESTLALVSVFQRATRYAAVS
jgi:hypothetical protein